MNTGGRLLKRYSRVIAECIPLFVVAGLISAFAARGSEGVYLQNMSWLISNLIVPVLVGYKSGFICGGDIGGLAGSLAAAAIVMTGSGSAVILSVLVGGAAGMFSRKGLEMIKTRIPAGFEMLFYNLYLTGIGILLGTVTYFFIVPATTWLMNCLNAGMTMMIAGGVLPFISIMVEPLKIMFFNNWINHGVFLPLGLEQAKTGGSSVLFLLESNPGPGLGILLAYIIMHKEKQKRMISSMIIHLLGGIHEVYFPYILSDIKLLAAAIVGGIAGNYYFMLSGSGLLGPASPGSVITILMMAEKRQWGFIILGLFISAGITCGIACLLMKAGANDVKNSGRKTCESMANKLADTKNDKRYNKGIQLKKNNQIRIYFVCDVGMGSSAMASALFRRKLKAEQLEGIEVLHVSADHIPDDADVIVCQKDFARTLPQRFLPGRSEGELPIKAKCFIVDNLTDMSCCQELLNWLREGE